jgi:hypothetical protein
MRQETTMNARTFGTDDKLDEFAAKYGSADYQTVGRAIADAQIKAQAGRDTYGRARQVGSDTRAQDRRLQRFASPKAIDYLVNLARTRTPDVQPIDIRNWAASVDRSEVSAKIDWLKTQPSVFISDNLAAHLSDDAIPAQDPVSNRLERHNVPAGRYAVTGNDGQTVFVKVDTSIEGQWAGRIFVKVQAGDELHRTSRPAADALLGKIAADGVKEAMLRYGREIGSCGHCGRTLTNEESRSIGVGPVCADKLGW